MPRQRLYQTRSTEISTVIESIRRRFGLGQVAFSRLVFGKPNPGQISRYESGRTAPSLKTLFSLLRLPLIREERHLILKALMEAGISEPDLAIAAPVSGTAVPDAISGDTPERSAS